MRCIPIKRKLVEFFDTVFPDFKFQATSGELYIFRKENIDHLYDYIFIQKEFFEGKISLAVSEVSCCYNQSWKGIPHSILGKSTSIGVLITGKNYYPAEIGWNQCDNNNQALDGLFHAIQKDIEKYVIPFFYQQHLELAQDTISKKIYTYTQHIFPKLKDLEIETLKQWLGQINRAYREHKQIERYFFAVECPTILQSWLETIEKELQKEKIQLDKNEIIKKLLILFRDYFGD